MIINVSGTMSQCDKKCTGWPKKMFPVFGELKVDNVWMAKSPSIRGQFQKSRRVLKSASPELSQTVLDFDNWPLNNGDMAL